jgi:hypothetical protein
MIARCILRFTLIDLCFAINRCKEVREISYTLGRTQQQNTVRVQCVVEQRHEPLLQLRAHINEEVAAANQIEFRKWRVFDDVVLGKNEHVADDLMDAVGSAVGLFLLEKVGQPLRRNVRDDTGWVNADAGLFDRFTVDIGGENLHLEALLLIFHVFAQQHRNGIGFLAGGTARHPDANDLVGKLAGEKLWNDLF